MSTATKPVRPTTIAEFPITERFPTIAAMLASDLYSRASLGGDRDKERFFTGPDVLEDYPLADLPPSRKFAFVDAYGCGERLFYRLRTDDGLCLLHEITGGGSCISDSPFNEVFILNFIEDYSDDVPRVVIKHRNWKKCSQNRRIFAAHHKTVTDIHS